MRAVTHTAVERKRSRLNESNDQFRPRIAPEADRSSQRVGVVGTQAHMARMPCRCRDRPGDRSNGRLEVANARSLSQITRPVPHLCPRPDLEFAHTPPRSFQPFSPGMVRAPAPAGLMRGAAVRSCLRCPITIHTPWMPPRPARLHRTDHRRLPISTPSQCWTVLVTPPGLRPSDVRHASTGGKICRVYNGED